MNTPASTLESLYGMPYAELVRRGIVGDTAREPQTIEEARQS